MIRVAGATATGPYHVRARQPNQDAVLAHGWRGGCLLAVSDGLGSRPRSQIGSRAAVRAARAVVRNSPEPDLVTLAERIRQAWEAGIAPYAPAEVACTLLVAAVDAQGNGFAAQLGDGLALWHDGEHLHVISQPKPDFSNETSGLGISRSTSDWTFAAISLAKPDSGIVLMSDGVADDLQPDSLANTIALLRQRLAQRSRRAQQRWLLRQFAGWPAHAGDDDKSMAMAFRCSA